MSSIRRFLAVSDIYPMFIEPTITLVPFGVLWVHNGSTQKLCYKKNCNCVGQDPRRHYITGARAKFVLLTLCRLGDLYSLFILICLHTNYCSVYML